MGMFGYVLVCMVMYGYVFLCMGMYGYLWVNITMDPQLNSKLDQAKHYTGPFSINNALVPWVCMDMFGYVWLCMDMYC